MTKEELENRVTLLENKNQELREKLAIYKQSTETLSESLTSLVKSITKVLS